MAAPMKVGILDDMSDSPPGPVDLQRWLRPAIQELIEAGRLDRGVEFVQGWGLGLPPGTAAAVERAFRSLVEQDVLMIVGPAIGDNALVATPLAEHYRVPTLNWAGAERARGEYMFHLQVGSHEDESILLARYMASLGLRRVGIVYDRSVIGRRHLAFLQAEAEIIGLPLVAAQPIGPLAEQASDEMEAVLDARIDGLVYLGLGLSAPAVATSLRARGWGGPCAMNTAGIRGYAPDFARLVDGWAYIDMHADGNRTLAAFREKLGLPPAQSFAAAKGHDLGRLVAEGLARAPERTRAGVKEGLEQIKWLPAAEGHQGTLLGFGVQDRGALHGRYLVLRQWRDAQSVEIEDPAG
jgi:ABC-type branched-subunit amino acid transport system substrate-binding protein